MIKMNKTIVVFRENSEYGEFSGTDILSVLNVSDRWSVDDIDTVVADIYGKNCKWNFAKVFTPKIEMKPTWTLED